MSGGLGNLFRDARKRYKITREKPQLWDFPDYGFGYIQIPKVATRSLRASLSQLPLMAEAADFADFEGRNSAHVDQAFIRRRIKEGLFVFAFVRDPLARLYSAWQNKVDRPEGAVSRNIFSCHGIYDHMPFDAFVRRVSELDDRHIDRHLRSQSWFLCDEQGVIPGFVGKLERFSAEWEQLRQRIPVLRPAPHYNRSASNGGGSLDFGKDTVQLVALRYREDYENFGYDSP